MSGRRPGAGGAARERVPPGSGNRPEAEARRAGVPLRQEYRQDSGTAPGLRRGRARFSAEREEGRDAAPA
jgi:hypothetical protein